MKTIKLILYITTMLFFKMVFSQGSKVYIHGKASKSEIEKQRVLNSIEYKSEKLNNITRAYDKELRAIFYPKIISNELKGSGYLKANKRVKTIISNNHLLAKCREIEILQKSIDRKADACKYIESVKKTAIKNIEWAKNKLRELRAKRINNIKRKKKYFSIDIEIEKQNKLLNKEIKNIDVLINKKTSNIDFTSNASEKEDYIIKFKGNGDIRGVENSKGKILIPYKKWKILSYKDGIAKTEKIIWSEEIDCGQCTYVYSFLKKVGYVDNLGNYIDGYIFKSDIKRKKRLACLRGKSSNDDRSWEEIDKEIDLEVIKSKRLLNKKLATKIKQYEKN